MLDKLPEELILIILHFLAIYNFNDFIMCMLISHKYEKLVNVHKIKKGEKFLYKFKICIEKLRFIQQGKTKLKYLKHLDFSETKYKKLYFKNVHFPNGLKNLTDLDPNISDKCEKFYFENCKNYSWSLINSLKNLKKCKSIKFSGETIDYYREVFLELDNYYILKLMCFLPKLQKISLVHWTLNEKCIKLLSKYEFINLIKCKITMN